MSTQKWVRSSLRTLSDRLKEAGHTLSPPTVGRLLRKLDYVYVGRKCPVDAEESDHLFRRKVTGHFGGK